MSKRISESLDDERPRPDGPDRAAYIHHLARYQFANAQINAGQRILDVGCGTGYGVHLLSQRATFALGLDYSHLAIRYAQDNFGAPNLAYAIMDGQRLAIRHSSFDVIVSFEVFEHFEDPNVFLHECSRLLRHGGRLFLSTPNQTTSDIHMKSIRQENEFHINLACLDRFRNFLRPFFSDVVIFGQRRRGSTLYSVVRGLDVFNWRLRFVRPQQREKMQAAMGVDTGEQVSAASWVFTRSQLRQANNFLAVCTKVR